MAVCGLLRDLTGLEALHCEVERLVCEVCCERPLSANGEHLNKMVASWLHTLTDRALEHAEGLPGLSREKAARLNDFASNNLEIAARPYGPPKRSFDGPCFYLGEPIADPSDNGGTDSLARHECLHERISETTEEQCRRCPEYEYRLADRKVNNWAVGVVTAPRRQSTLNKTLTSLASAGWSEPHVFAEPGTPRSPNHSGPLTIRTKKMGAWPNWFLALSELAQLHPDADAYLICQDDVVFSRNVRAYLEETLWPAHRMGVVSLYTAHDFGRGDIVDYHEDDRVRDPFGALAYVFPNAAARSLLRDSVLINHRRNEKYLEGRAQVDFLVGLWARRNHLPYYFHSPSLAQHIGDHSAVFKKARNRGWRKSSNFAGEEFDAVELLNQADRHFDESNAIQPDQSKVDVTAVLRAIGENRGSESESNWNPTSWPEPPIRCDVVLPYGDTYRKWVPACVESLLNQSEATAIVHLVDDCCDDPSPPLPDELMRCGRIRWYRNQSNVGPYASLMRIWDRLETPYVAIADADDIYAPGRIAAAVRAIRSGADIWGANMENFCDWHDSANADLRAYVEQNPVIYSGRKWPNCPAGTIFNPTMVFRRWWFEQVNGFSNWKFGADREFAQRSREAGAQVTLADTIVGWRRVHSASSVHNEDTGEGSAARRQLDDRLIERIGKSSDASFAREFGDLHRVRAEAMKTETLIGRTDYPFVTCLMVTSDPGRIGMVREAVADFLAQSYPLEHRELLIVCDRDHELPTGPGIRSIRVPRTPSCGAMRNHGIKVLKPGYVLQWDDDDRYSPDRITEQVRWLEPGWSVTLRWQIRYHVQTGAAFVHERRTLPEMGIEGTLLYLNKGHEYLDANMGDDTRMAELMAPLIVAETDPFMHVRRFHGTNICSEQHIMRGREQLELPAWQAVRLEALFPNG